MRLEGATGAAAGATSVGGAGSSLTSSSLSCSCSVTKRSSVKRRRAHTPRQTRCTAVTGLGGGGRGAAAAVAIASGAKLAWGKVRTSRMIYVPSTTPSGAVRAPAAGPRPSTRSRGRCRTGCTAASRGRAPLKGGHGLLAAACGAAHRVILQQCGRNWQVLRPCFALFFQHSLIDILANVFASHE